MGWTRTRVLVDQMRAVDANRLGEFADRLGAAEIGGGASQAQAAVLGRAAVSHLGAVPVMGHPGQRDRVPGGRTRLGIGVAQPDEQAGPYVDVVVTVVDRHPANPWPSSP